MERVCQNCKYWSRNVDDLEFKDERFGECKKTVDISDKGIQTDLPDNIATSSDYDSYKSNLETGQNFGCIHFEKGGE